MKPYSEQDVYIVEALEYIAATFTVDSSWRPSFYRTRLKVETILTLSGVNPETGDFLLRNLELLKETKLMKTSHTNDSPHELFESLARLEEKSLSDLVWDRDSEDRLYGTKSVLWLDKREYPLGVEYERLAHFARALGGTYEPGKGAVDGAVEGN